jgi:hypothetical protein
VLGASKLSAVLANDLSDLIGTTEVVSNETNRIVTGDSDDAISRDIWRMAEKQSYSGRSGKAFRRLRKDFLTKDSNKHHIDVHR